MRDQDKTKEQLIADLETMRKQLAVFEQAELRRNASLRLLSEMPKMMDDRRHSSGYWYWYPDRGSVDFERNLSEWEIKSAFVNSSWKVFTEKWFEGEWEEIVHPDDLNSLMRDLKSICAKEENDPAFHFRTKHIANAAQSIMATSCTHAPDGIDEIFGEYIDPIRFSESIEKLSQANELSKTFKEVQLQDFLDSGHENELVVAVMWDILINEILKDYPDVIEVMQTRVFPYYEKIQSRLQDEERQNNLFRGWIAFISSAIRRSHVALFMKFKGQYQFVSPAFASLVGLSEFEIEGKTDLQLFGEGNTEEYEEIFYDNDLPVWSKLVTINTGKTVTELMIIQMREEDPDHPDGSIDGSQNHLAISSHVASMLIHSENVQLARGPSTGWGLACNPDDIESSVESSGGVIEYKSKAMLYAKELALKVAKSDTIVLLTGETGAGKDHLAKYIHKHSKRADGPYFSINCAAVASQIAESELFGHEKGAFTGAHRRKRGLLEIANGGTIILNEIGDASPEIQAKLLQFLETKRFTRVGGENEIPADVRLIAATNKDLEVEVELGRFRNDLFYRLNVFPIHIPPLRERKDDIPVLVQEVLRKIQEDIGLPNVPNLAPAAVREMRDYDWPGNVREMENLLLRSAILSEGRSLRVNFPKLTSTHGTEPSEVDESQEARSIARSIWSVGFPPQKKLEELAKDMKRSLINEALRHSGGNITRAAPLLHISRDALNTQIKNLKMHVAKRHTVDGEVSDSHSSS